MQPFRKVSPQELQRIYAEQAPTYHKTQQFGQNHCAA
jgi:hypothetical protein